MKLLGLSSLLAFLPILSLAQVPERPKPIEKSKPILIVSGGQRTIEMLKPKLGELERIVQAPIEFKRYSAELAMANMARGVADIVIAPAGKDMAVALSVLAKTPGLPKFTSADFQSTPIAELMIFAAVHPSNPVREFTREQLSSMLSGKTVNWMSVSGKQAPIKILYAKDKIFVNNTINRVYNGGKEPPKVEFTLDHLGLVRAIHTDPNSIAFFVEKGAKVDGFEPKYLNTQATIATDFISKSKPRPEVQKLYEYFKTNGIVKEE